MSGWISVKDRLPEQYQNILIAGRDFVDLGYLADCSFEGCRWRLSLADTYAGSEVTHWMPLPEPPTPTSEEE